MRTFKLRVIIIGILIAATCSISYLMVRMSSHRPLDPLHDDRNIAFKQSLQKNRFVGAKDKHRHVAELDLYGTDKDKLGKVSDRTKHIHQDNGIQQSDVHAGSRQDRFNQEDEDISDVQDGIVESNQLGMKKKHTASNTKQNGRSKDNRVFNADGESYKLEQQNEEQLSKDINEEDDDAGDYVSINDGIENLEANKGDSLKAASAAVSADRVVKSVVDNQKVSADNKEASNDYDDQEEVILSKDELNVRKTAPPQFSSHDAMVRAGILLQHGGVPASHLRSHNIPPVPQVPAHFFGENKLQKVTPVKAKRPPTAEDSVAGLHVSYEEGIDSTYYVVHNGRASKVNRATQYRILPRSIDEASYIYSSKSLPDDPRQRPSIGNGILATVIHGSNIYMSGLYNGIGSESHRAAIPSTCSFRIAATEPAAELNRTYQLNAATGIFSEFITAPKFNITQQFYVHRTLQNVIVVEVDVVRSNPERSLKLKLDLTQWTSSYDFTFNKHDTVKEEVSYKIGKLNAAESEDAHSPEVHVMYDHIPKELEPPRTARRTKFIFLTSIGRTKEETELHYEAAKEKIHLLDGLHASHVRGWASVWGKGRIDIEGNVTVARAVYASWYYLLSSLPLQYRPDFVGLSPSGLPLGDTGKDYEGRVMYDQELWMYPPLLLLHTEIASTIVTSRQRQTGSARQNAKLLGQDQGVLYPWQSGATGMEVNPDQARGLKSPFVSAGVVWSILQSVLASGNSGSVTNTTLGELVNGICHTLLTKITSSAHNQQYAVNNVIPLDESQGLVNNSAFVNGIVKLALSTPRYIYGLENQTTTEFHRFSNLLNVKDGESYHAAFDGYKPGTIISKPDAVLLGYPLQLPMSHALRLGDLTQYEQAVGLMTSPLTWAMHSIGWFELGDTKHAQLLFDKQFQFIANSFQVWSNSSSNRYQNNAYNYLSAAGGFLQSIINGYAGIRLRSDRLEIDPELPPGVTRMHFVGIDYRGSHLDVVVSRFEVMVVVTAVDQNSAPLKLFSFDPEETHSLNLKVEVRIGRKPVAISAAAFLPSSSPPLVAE